MRTYNFPLEGGLARPVPASTGEAVVNPKAYQTLRGQGVTCFSSLRAAYAIYVASFAWSAFIITLSALLIVAGNDHTGVTSTVNTIENGQNQWAINAAGIMLGMDILVLLTQALDLLCFHFTRWPLTAMTWFGMLNGTGLASALLGTYLYYPHGNDGQRDAKLGLAMGSLAAHALYISAQFSVTLEYIMRMLKRK